MDFFNLLTLFGGLAMFLYGMRLMGDALKESSSGTLKTAMEHVTDNPVKAFLLGVAITALIQSSTATIVITSGLVGAGILTLRQSLGIIVGANVGTTVTGQIIRLLDIDAGSGSVLRLFQPSTLAPLALIIGIVLIMFVQFKNSKSIGNIAMGFGILFSGLMNMTGAVDTLAESGVAEQLFSGLGSNPVLGYLTGAAVAFVLQSSSATIGILQAFSASGVLTFNAIYAVIVGIYLGDCVTTAIVCSIGADTENKRVGAVNILYNLFKSALVLVGVNLLHVFGALDGLWNAVANSGLIANTNTVFNLVCAVLALPLMPSLERVSKLLIKEAPEREERYKERLEALSPVFFNTPALALRSCYDLLLTILHASRENLKRAVPLLDRFDEAAFQAIQKEEEEIDRLTDRLSRYIVELLPHLQEEYHLSIIDQYYKVSKEFERLGDHAVAISEIARNLCLGKSAFSEAASAELKVLDALTERILDDVELAFGKRDLQAAERLEPLTQAMTDLISKLSEHHLIRLSHGQCSIYSDASFTNLLTNYKHIAGTCSNVGVAVVVRIRPELAEQEHNYYSYLHSGRDEAFNRAYDDAYAEYYAMLKAADRSLKAMPDKEV